MKPGRAALLIGCLALAFLSGCAQDEPISSYTVLKPESLARSVGAITVELPGDAQAAKTGPDRLLGAIVPHTDRVWFFKLVGPKDAVAAVKDDFNSVVGSLRFAAADKPEWTLPKTWKQEPGGEMRFATLRIEDATPLEVSVSSLPRGQETDAFYSIVNINRWRGQLGLKPIGSHQLAHATQPLPWQNGTALTVDFVGTMSAGPMSTGTKTITGQKSVGGESLRRPTATNQPTAPAASGELKYDTPPGWTAGRSGGFRKAAFNIQDGDRKAEVTIIDLGPQAGDWLSNVNRWRDQIGLADIGAEELSRITRKISIGQQAADYVELSGPGAKDPGGKESSAARPQAILAVAIPTRDKTWFIKLIGDADLVGREKQNFETFVKSLRLPD